MWCAYAASHQLDTLNKAYKLWHFIMNITGSRADFTFRCIIFPTVALVHGKFIPHECLIVKTLSPI